jgi:cardiolipin synthase
MKNGQGKARKQVSSSGVSAYKEPYGKLSCLKKYIPNTLTIFRLITIPLCVGFVLQARLTAAFWIFFASSITDWLDGYLARRWRVISKLGQILDPLADKALVASLYLTLGIQGYIPLWLAGLVIMRDFLILTCSTIILMRHMTNTSLVPILIGKLCATFQMLFIGLILMKEAALIPLSSSGNSSFIMVSCLYVVVFITIASGITYGRVVHQVLQK